MNLSPHFTLAEMTHTEVRAKNTPGPHEIANLQRLAAVMEKVRARFGPYRIHSAYRSLLVNSAIGGSKTSAHLDGRAADGRPVNQAVTLKEVMEWVVNESGIDFDQVIYEFSRWIHLAIPKDGHPARKQALMISHAGVYETWDPTAVR